MRPAINSRLGSEITLAAARLMRQTGLADDWRARHKAARQLGVNRRGLCPGQRAIERALIACRVLFRGRARRRAKPLKIARPARR